MIYLSTMSNEHFKNGPRRAPRIKDLLCSSARRGPFWDVVEGRLPPPPAAVLLGFELLSVDPEAGTIEVRLYGDRAVPESGRQCPGRSVGSMLDDTLGPALVATLSPREWGTYHRSARAVPPPRTAGADHWSRADRATRRPGGVSGRRALRRARRNTRNGDGHCEHPLQPQVVTSSDFCV